MHVVIFGLTISSSWGNGHATLWRSLVRAMTRRGHTVTFYEKNVPYYSGARDLCELAGRARLRLYASFSDIAEEAKRETNSADLALCTSFCPDGPAAAELILASHAEIKAFYDMDTPVTLDALSDARQVDYLPSNGLSAFHLVLSYTGGRALDELRIRLGARDVAPLYGWVDPDTHRPVPPVDRFRAELSYLGTYAADRQHALTELFLRPAAAMPAQRFIIGGAQYPEHFPWTSNIFFTQHLEPAQHAAFFCSSRATLNVTRRAMSEYGYCPSGRMFEAAACGATLLTDTWAGIDTFFKPDDEIFLVRTADDVRDVLSSSDAELAVVAKAARARTLEQHTADCRVKELERICEQLTGGLCTAIAS